MKLSDNAICDFQKTHQSRFGISLSEEEANEKGLELLEFMKIVYREVPKVNQEFLNSLRIEGLEHKDAMYK